MHTIRVWFWNQNECRLRSGWRVLVHAVLTSGTAFGLYYSGVFSPGKLYLARIEVGLLIVTIITTSLAARFLDRRALRDLGVHLRRRDWGRDLGFGLVLGLAEAGGLVLVASKLGWVQVRPHFRTTESGIGLVLAVLVDQATFVCVGAFEELIRGYQVRNVAEGLAQTRLGGRGALLAGVAVAGLYSTAMHLNQQGTSFWLYVFANSAFYCLCYLLTGRIAIAIGLHAAWDFFISTVVSLGGAGMNAAALWVAPLTASGELAADRGLIALVGLGLDLVSLPLLVAYVRHRYGGIRLDDAMAVYRTRDISSAGAPVAAQDSQTISQPRACRPPIQSL